ncbi:MAG TPA: histidine triad nucleotide-binding protein [Candidatus Latescibacteria bacterium]|nr:MAG: HIT-like protein [Candidatus Latescibacteria bacterium ADurb.Bin168]HPU85876.1 histidine triad nucleotide-binding protein [Candidatus Latescibacterota bacterium]
MPTLFSRIAAGEIPATIVARTSDCFAIEDINPQAPVHVLIVPLKEIPSVNSLTAEDESLVGKMVLLAREIAAQRGLQEGGYRLVFNCGPDAGQTVDHLHLHLLGGRSFGWPPG